MTGGPLSGNRENECVEPSELVARIVFDEDVTEEGRSSTPGGLELLLEDLDVDEVAVVEGDAAAKNQVR